MEFWQGGDDDLMKALRMMLFLLLILVVPTGAFAAMPDISAGNTYFELGSGCYVLEGNVRVAARGRVMTAKEARVQITSQKVWAKGDVTLVQDGITFHCDSIFVQGKEKSVDILGNVNFVQEDVITITSDIAHFSWDTKLADFYGNVRVQENGKEEQVYDHIQYHVREQKLLATDTHLDSIPEPDMEVTPEEDGDAGMLP